MYMCVYISQFIPQNGDTPIHLVFQSELLVDYSEILHLLIHHGANVNVQNKVHVNMYVSHSIEYVHVGTWVVQHYVHYFVA